MRHFIDTQILNIITVRNIIGDYVLYNVAHDIVN